MLRRAVVTAVVLAATFGGVLVALPASAEVPNLFTGCVRPNGTLYKLSMGTSPSSPCTANESQISIDNGDITAIEAGEGITGGGTLGNLTLSADTNYLQRRVSGTCSVGSSIQAINIDGTVVCEASPGGDITSVTAGPGLIGGGASGDVTLSLASTVPSSDGWSTTNESWTYVTATSITVPSDATTKYSVGDKVRLKQGGAYKFFYIIGVSSTTLTVTGGVDYSVANAAITANDYSKASTPLGFPQWFHWAPTYNGGYTMTFTDVTTNEAKFSIVGRTVHIILSAYGTTGGIADPVIVVSSLPVTGVTSFSTGKIAGGGYIYDDGFYNALVYADGSSLTIRKTSNFGIRPNVEIGTSYSYDF